MKVYKIPSGQGFVRSLSNGGLGYIAIPCDETPGYIDSDWEEQKEMSPVGPAELADGIRIQSFRDKDGFVVNAYLD